MYFVFIDRTSLGKNRFMRNGLSLVVDRVLLKFFIARYHGHLRFEVTVRPGRAEIEMSDEE